MRHFSCDHCGRTLTPGEEPRYLVRVEGFALHDDTGIEETDADSVDAMEELLTEQVALEAVELDDMAQPVPGNARREYDLCRACYAKMLSDPLGHDARTVPRFSRN